MSHVQLKQYHRELGISCLFIVTFPLYGLVLRFITKADSSNFMPIVIVLTIQGRKIEHTEAVRTWECDSAYLKAMLTSDQWQQGGPVPNSS